MVELSEHTMLDYFGDNGKDVIEVDDDPVVVFADFSGTQISKNSTSRKIMGWNKNRQNSPTAKFCQNCGQALSTEAYEEIEEGEKWIETLESQNVRAESSLESILEQVVEKKIKQMR